MSKSIHDPAGLAEHFTRAVASGMHTGETSSSGQGGGTVKLAAGKAILGGFVATVVMTPLMYFVPLVLGMPMDIGAMLGKMLGNSWMLGMMLHFINGSILFPLIYAYALYDVLPGSSWLKGTVWGVILWFLAQSVVMPMMGAGFFSSAIGGGLAVLGSLVMHVIYGTTLGALAGGPEQASGSSPPEQESPACRCWGRL